MPMKRTAQKLTTHNNKLNNMTDYTCWGQRELIEELHIRDSQLRELDEECNHCGEKMNTIVRAHHHTEVFKRREMDVTKGLTLEKYTCEECGDYTYLNIKSGVCAKHLQK